MGFRSPVENLGVVMQFDEVIARRHSVRKYSPQDILPEDLERILEATIQAPSAGNLQAYRIFAIRDPSKKASISACAFNQEFIKDASVILVFAADPDASFSEYGERGSTLYCIQDATIAATFAILKATDLGYSTAWIGSFDGRKLLQSVGARGVMPVAIVLVGKGAEKPLSTPRKSLKDIVDYIG